MALDLMVMGTGIRVSFVPLYANYLLSNYGWIGFMSLAATLLCGNLFALAFMVRIPETKSPVSETESAGLARAPATAP